MDTPVLVPFVDSRSGARTRVKKRKQQNHSRRARQDADDTDEYEEGRNQDGVEKLHDARPASSAVVGKEDAIVVGNDRINC